MMTLLYIAFAFSASFIVAVVPFGFQPSMPEFWFALGVFGMPLLLMAWPVYVRLLRGATIPLTLKPVAGFCLFPIPAVLLQLGYWVVNGDLIVNPIRFFNGPFMAFLVWYIVFGLALGALLAFEQWRARP